MSALDQDLGPLRHRWRRGALAGAALLFACSCTAAALGFLARDDHARAPASRLLDFASDGADAYDGAGAYDADGELNATAGLEKFDTAQADIPAYERASGCGHCMWMRCLSWQMCGRFYEDSDRGGYGRGYCMCGCCRMQCGLPKWCDATLPYPSDGMHTQVSTLALSGEPLLKPGQSAASADGSLLYVVDETGHAVRAVNLSSGLVRTVAGTGALGYADGVGTAAAFSHPRGLVLLPGSSPPKLVVADTGNNRLRLISDPDSATPTVTTLAGSGEEDLVDGIGAKAAFSRPLGLAATADFVVVADTGNDAVRLFTLSDGLTSTLAGTFESPPHDGPLDGKGSAARFAGPAGVALSASASRVFVADRGNHAIRAIDLESGEVTTLAGNGLHGASRGSKSTFFNPGDVALLPTDPNLLVITDTMNRVVRMLDLGRCDGNGANCYSLVLAGIPGETGSADGAGPAARFTLPSTVAVLPASAEEEAAGVTRLALSDIGTKQLRVLELTGKPSSTS